MSRHDFTFSLIGSVGLLRPNSLAAGEWIDINIPKDATTWGGALVLDSRDADGILSGLTHDGLSVERA